MILITNKIKSLASSNFFYILLIIIFAFITRVGFWNLIIAGGWDEITYLLSGREILNGQIPYRDFFEVKPPVAFLPYIIANLFENETLAIRIIGFLVIALCSYFIFEQSSKITNSFIAKIITLSFVILNSQITFQNTGLTIFIYPFLLFISNILLFKKQNNINYIIIGFCVSIICLIRPNFYPLVFGIILIIYLYNHDKIKNILFYFLGGAFPVLIIILFYFSIDNGLNILLNLIINLLAAGENIKVSWTFREIIRYLFDGVDGIIFLSSILIVVYNFKEIIKIKQNVIILILFGSTVTSVLIVFTGHHQLNNFYPYLLLVIALIFRNMDIKNNTIKDQILILVFCSIIPVLMSSSIAIIKNYKFFFNTERELFSYNFNNTDKNSDAVEYLKNLIKPEEKIFAYDHFFYLKLNKKLPSKIIHPSTLWRIPIYKNINGVEDTTEKEFEKIISKEPDWLIIRKDIFDKKNYLPKKFKNIIITEWKLFSIVEANSDQYLFKKK